MGRGALPQGAVKLNLGSGRYPLDGFENLNEPEWKAENGLPYSDGTVEAITVSHMLMYLDDLALAVLLDDCYRVLEPLGVLRITEDETLDPNSRRKGGQPNAVRQTSWTEMPGRLHAAGFTTVYHVLASTTYWKDDSLIQQFHGGTPDVFHMEAIKGGV